MPLKGLSTATPMERTANRAEFFGLAHSGEYTKLYWITVAMSIKAQKVLGAGVDVSVTGDTFSRGHINREPREIRALLNAGVDLLLMFLDSNAYGNSVRNGRSEDLSMAMVYPHAKAAYPKLYHEVSYAVTYSYQQTPWSSEPQSWKQRLSKFECAPYLDGQMVSKMLLNKDRREELTSHVFAREVILTRLRLFQKVSIVTYTMFWNFLC